MQGAQGVDDCITKTKVGVFSHSRWERRDQLLTSAACTCHSLKINHSCIWIIDTQIILMKFPNLQRFWGFLIWFNKIPSAVRKGEGLGGHQRKGSSTCRRHQTLTRRASEALDLMKKVGAEKGRYRDIGREAERVRGSRLSLSKQKFICMDVSRVFVNDEVDDKYERMEFYYYAMRLMACQMME